MSATSPGTAARAASDGPGPPAPESLMLLAFEGATVPGWVTRRLAESDVAGFTLGRYRNVHDLEQVRALTDALQAARSSELPLLVAADQEGGQLIGLGDGTTPFGGNLALGAAGDPDLAERVGRATGRELRALGVTVNYAPVCDVITDPDNPSLGIRAFGDDPVAAGALAVAMVRGLQAEGVAATAKHFPGKGDARVDPHHELPVLDVDRDRLDAVEFVPFRAAIDAGVRILMVGHYAVPSITGDPVVPTSLSPAALRVVRRDLGFGGVIVTDSLDMGAVSTAGHVSGRAAIGAGADLLLCGHGPEAAEGIAAGLRAAWDDGTLDPARRTTALARVEALRRWTGGFPQPALDVVRSGEHLGLAREVADRSVTLVRDQAGILPIRLPAAARIAAIMPAPADLTPADTSATVAPGLADALRRRHRAVDAFVTGHPPTPAEIGALRDAAAAYDLLIVGTIEAARSPGQADLVVALRSTGVPTVVVALRTPHDLVAFPDVTTYACTYGLLPPALEALADALWGVVPFLGRLPTRIPGLYPTGHGAT